MTEQGKKETVHVFLLNLLSKVFTYLMLLVLGNYYLLNDYGQASFVRSVFYVILFFSTIGVPGMLTPWIIKKKDVNSIFYFHSIITLIVFAGGLFISFYKYLWILPIVISLPFMFFRQFGYAYLRSRYKYNLTQLSDTTLAFVTALFVFLLHNHGKTGIILAYSMGFMVSSLFVIYLEHNNLAKLLQKFRLDFINILSFLRKGIIVSLLSLSFSFLSWIDSIVLGWLSTFDNVAKYNIAGPISNVISLVSIPISLFILTRSAHLNDKLISLKVLNRSLRISFSLSLLFAIALNSLLFVLIKIFFPKYIGVEIYIMVLSIGIVLFALYGVCHNYLTGKFQPELSLLPVGLGALVNFILDLCLIPSFGLMGIVVATLIAHLVSFTFMFIRLKILKKYLSVLLLVGLIPLSYYLRVVGLFIIGPLAIVLLYLFGYLRKSDIEVIKKTIVSIFSAGKKN